MMSFGFINFYIQSRISTTDLSALELKVSVFLSLGVTSTPLQSALFLRVR
jgi:hypothetical protein